MEVREDRKSGRDFGVLAAGLAAGVLGSRLLPPLVAMVSGRVRARRGSDPFEVLVNDHRLILSVLDRMADQPAESNARRASLFLVLKRKLAKHAMAEEDVVYPLLHGRGHNPDGSKELYEEHADMKIMLFQLEELLMSGADWREPVGRLRELIRSHIDEEERVVFPQLRQLMDRGGVPKLSGQIRREEALVL
jgi:iron-sulfur cluster repair protein YtfE (RIC family)